jgi:hypothetical protein
LLICTGGLYSHLSKPLALKNLGRQKNTFLFIFINFSAGGKGRTRKKLEGKKGAACHPLLTLGMVGGIR